MSLSFSYSRNTPIWKVMKVMCTDANVVGLFVRDRFLFVFDCPFEHV